jgi:hypothetical protein
MLTAGPPVILRPPRCKGEQLDTNGAPVGLTKLPKQFRVQRVTLPELCPSSSTERTAFFAIPVAKNRLPSVVLLRQERCQWGPAGHPATP